MAEAAWPIEIRGAELGGTEVDGAPAIGRGDRPSSWSMVSRRPDTAEARSAITWVNRGLTSPVGVGGTLWSAWYACCAVDQIARSSPCWIRSEEHTSELQSL